MQQLKWHKLKKNAVLSNAVGVRVPSQKVIFTSVGKVNSLQSSYNHYVTNMAKIIAIFTS